MSGLRVLGVVGARPNLMKMAPLVHEMRSSPDIEVLLVHTGQHYDDRMSGAFLRDLEMPEPDFHLGVGSGSHARQTAEVMLGLEPILERTAPDLVVVVGDVNSTVAAAIVAAKLRIPVAHVEAGLRSHDWSMPEEVNRVLTDSVSDLLFTTERSAGENLMREGAAPESIHFVGNTMIDTLLRYRTRAEAGDVLQRLEVDSGRYALLTLHRPSNVDDPQVFGRLLAGVERIAQRVPVVFPVHPRTLMRLEELDLLDRARGVAELRMVEPLGYLDFLGLMARAALVLTDSGGVQEETTVLGVPCLTLRENTERPVTLTEGTNRLVGTEPGRIAAEGEKVLANGAGAASVPELWDGRASQRIVEIIRREFAR